jgi:hypothetical protein
MYNGGFNVRPPFLFLLLKEEPMIEKIKEKIHIIFIVVMIIYLSALATMTVYTYLDERPYWEKQEKQKISEQAKNRKGGN